MTFKNIHEVREWAIAAYLDDKLYEETFKELLRLTFPEKQETGMIYVSPTDDFSPFPPCGILPTPRDIDTTIIGKDCYPAKVEIENDWAGD